MSTLAISAEHLGKRYRIGAAAEVSDSFREAVVHGLKRQWRRVTRRRPDERSQVWALRGVSFDVQHGEILGVVGRNGAGKSTLLKILSRITKPSEGRVHLRGRVGSLLEVGTGFHPELTGRDNIYLNGAILGMDKAYISRRFDEIVAFSEIERFLDTPVKRYSSGMYLRLAFAVAAHLETDVLIVDEVLAVGDAEFQRKCIGKMGQATKQGRTVLFVSHNMAAVQALCTRALLIERGQLLAQGPTDEVLERYMRGHADAGDSAVSLEAHPNRRPGSEPVLREIAMTADGIPARTACMGGSITLTLRFAHQEDMPNLRVGLAFENALGQRLFNASIEQQAPHLSPARVRAGEIRCHIPAVPLVPGNYYVTIVLATRSTEYIDRIDQALEFSVESRDVFGTGRPPGPSHGVVFVPAEWEWLNRDDGARGSWPAPVTPSAQSAAECPPPPGHGRH